MIFGILIQFDTANSKINIKKAVPLWETVDAQNTKTKRISWLIL